MLTRRELLKRLSVGADRNMHGGGRVERIGVDVVVVTALPEEPEAVLAVLAKAGLRCEAVSDDYVTTVGALRVVVVSLFGMGNVTAATVTSRVIVRWRPKHLVLVGIAAGVRGHDNVQLGDVLVAEQVVGFEQAKVTAEGAQPRYEPYRTAHDLVAAARRVTVKSWVPGMTTPRPTGSGGLQATPTVHYGTVLSGEKVFADRAAVDAVCRNWPRAVGIEMESLGVAAAAHQAGCGFLVVKGVTDFGDINKDDQWRRYAAEAAARFTLATLRHLPARQDGTALARMHRARRPLATAAVLLGVVAICAADTPRSPPTEASRDVLFSGTLKLDRGWAVDLHTTGSGWSIFRGCDSACDLTVTPTEISGNRARFQIVTDRDPHNSCRVLPATQSSINRVRLHPDTQICLQTNDHRRALLTVITTDPVQPILEDLRSVTVHAIAYRS